MAQHDQVIANQTFPSTRSDINAALAALFSLSSGTSAPSTTIAGMLWYDTTNSLIKQRNAADDGWLTLFAIGKQGLVPQDFSTVYAVASGSSNAFTASFSPTPAAMPFLIFKANHTISGASSMNPNSLGAKAIKKENDQDTEAGDIEDGQIVVLFDDGTNYQMISPVASSPTVGLPTLFRAGAAPVWLTAATFSVANFNVRNSADDGDIKKTSSTTVNMATLGAVNGIAQSANLTGTISCSGTTVTGTGTAFTTDFQVGDVIHSVTDGTARRITAIGSNTSLTVSVSWTITGGTSFKRGGEAPSTFYYLYAITDGSTPALILSTRNVAAGHTLTDLPSGYNKSRQMAFAIRNNASNDIIRFLVMDGWPYRPWIRYDVNMSTAAAALGETNVLDSGTATSWASVTLTSFIPTALAKIVEINILIETTNGHVFIRPGDSSGNGFVRTRGASSGGPVGSDSDLLRVDTADDTIDYQMSSAGAISLDVQGFVVTEVV